MLQASFDLDKKQSEIELQKARIAASFLLVMVFRGIVSLLVLAIILLRNNSKNKSKCFIAKNQKREIDDKARELSVQRDNLEQSYKNIELLGEIGRRSLHLSVETIMKVYDNVNLLMMPSVFGIGIYNEELKKSIFPLLTKMASHCLFIRIRSMIRTGLPLCVYQR